MPSNKKAVQKSGFHLEAELDKTVEVVFFSLHNLNFQQSGFSMWSLQCIQYLLVDESEMHFFPTVFCWKLSEDRFSGAALYRKAIAVIFLLFFLLRFFFFALIAFFYDL